MDRQGAVLGYNQQESRLSGLPSPSVIGRDFFTDVGPCTNYLVAQRHTDSDELDERLD